MDNNYLTKFILTKERNVQKFFRGVFNLSDFYQSALNKINRNESNIFIFNSESTKAYGHWLLFMTCSRTEKAFFIDSFAKDPSYYDPDLQSFLESLCPVGVYETLPYEIQGKVKSETCGLWCLLFASSFAKNPELFTIKKVTQAFHFYEYSTNVNDQKLMNYFARKYLISKDKLLNAQRFGGDKQKSVSYSKLQSKTEY